MSCCRNCKNRASPQYAVSRALLDSFYLKKSCCIGRTNRASPWYGLCDGAVGHYHPKTSCHTGCINMASPQCAILHVFEGDCFLQSPCCSNCRNMVVVPLPQNEHVLYALLDTFYLQMSCCSGRMDNVSPWNGHCIKKAPPQNGHLAEF